MWRKPAAGRPAPPGAGRARGRFPERAPPGRRLAGAMRARKDQRRLTELTPTAVAAPVIIIGMGAVGRLVADALISFGIDYYAVERAHQRLAPAPADGYRVGFGDGSDARLWPTVALGEREL